uniref:Interleukin-12 subunit alpha n=1 Tax=Mola mola TaxID=94237 RepID=A0A3Q3WNX0_MOLML
MANVHFCKSPGAEHRLKGYCRCVFVSNGACVYTLLLSPRADLASCALLLSGVLCFGITSTSMVVRSKSDTVRACAPTLTQNSSCMMQRNSSFSESECLRNIRKDLVHYSAAIKSYLDFPLRMEEERPLLSPTLATLQSLRENCSLVPNEEDSSEDDVTRIWGNDTFSNRQEMCKMVRGLYARTITINRAMGYIASSDHRK